MQKKEEVISFKVDEALARAMNTIPNRSEFIRSAILSAMNNICPLCSGTGILTTDQRRHWDAFAREHTIEECDACHAYHLVCNTRHG